MSQESSTRQTGRPAPPAGGPQKQIAAPVDPLERKTQMHPEDLMSADMLSEILLLVSGSVIFVTLLLILAAVLTQTAAVR